MDLLDALKTRVLLCDGGMGTELIRAGMPLGACSALWNQTAPQRVLAIHRAYVGAGAEVLLTNTFRGSRFVLEQYGAADLVAEINTTGVRLARRACSPRGYVVGDMGPNWMPHWPEAEFARVGPALREQAALLVEAGVDAIALETQFTAKEAEVGVAAAREAGARCVILSWGFSVVPDGNVVSPGGETPESAARVAVATGADVLGLNCGVDLGMADAARILQRFRQVCDLPLLAKVNAGLPNHAVEYALDPATMAAGLPAVLRAGARMVGGCCGTTPEHIAALRYAM